MSATSSQNITVHRISTTEEFETLEQGWETLLAQNHTRSAFLSWEWLFAWWTIYGEGKQLWVIAAFKDQALVGIAPLMIEERKEYLTNQRVLCSLGGYDIDVGGLLLAKEEQSATVAAIMNFLGEEKRQWDVIELYEFRTSTIDTEKIIENSLARNYLIRKKLKEHFHVLIEEDWDRFFMKFSGNLRGDMRRRLKKIKKKGEISFVYHQGNEITWDEITTIFEINQYGNYAYLYRSESEREFQREVFLRMKGKGTLGIFLLYFDDAPIAYRYGFIIGQKFEDWRNGFDTRYTQHAPGKVLQLLTFQECLKQGYTAFDFLRGEEQYKKRMPSEAESYIELVLVPREKLTTLFTHWWMPKLRKSIKNALQR